MRKKILCVLMTAALTTAVQAASIFEAKNSVPCGHLADSVVFALDVSGSMMNRDEGAELTRAEQAREFVVKILEEAADKAPAKASVITLAPFTKLVPEGEFKPEDMRKTLDERLPRLEVFGRPTWVGERAMTHLSTPAAGTQAMVVVTDGEVELKRDAHRKLAEALNAYKAANPSAALRLVSAARTDEEKASVEALKAEVQFAGVYELDALVADDAQRKAFVTDAFWRECPKVEVVEIQDIYFDFDKSTLTPDSVERLKEAVAFVKTRDPSETITIAGWTDFRGSDAYNAGLSKRRADAVKTFFEKEGIDPARMSTEGNGKSFKYDNETAEGRHMNRRVELIFTK